MNDIISNLFSIIISSAFYKSFTSQKMNNVVKLIAIPDIDPRDGYLSKKIIPKPICLKQPYTNEH